MHNKNKREKKSKNKIKRADGNIHKIQFSTEWDNQGYMVLVCILAIFHEFINQFVSN